MNKQAKDYEEPIHYQTTLNEDGCSAIVPLCNNTGNKLNWKWTWEMSEVTCVECLRILKELSNGNNSTK